MKKEVNITKYNLTRKLKPKEAAKNCVVNVCVKMHNQQVKYIFYHIIITYTMISTVPDGNFSELSYIQYLTRKLFEKEEMAKTQTNKICIIFECVKESRIKL